MPLLEVEASKLAWQKTKSRRGGRSLTTASLIDYTGARFVQCPRFIVAGALYCTVRNSTTFAVATHTVCTIHKYTSEKPARVHCKKKERVPKIDVYTSCSVANGYL